ncbi:MAG: aminoglycoside phosphotransferase family protein [Coxiellaceae bacterium]|nr:aminoglycoside phosphotransferase family protein [Coxiellaceae bacterium]
MHKTLQKNIRDLYGEQGELWLAQLPEQLQQLQQQLNIELQTPFDDLSFNYVAPGVDQNNNAIALKIGVPNPDITHEIQALQHYNSQGAVQLIDSSNEYGWLLLQQCIPGDTLKTLYNENNDDQACEAAAAIMQRLWQPPKEPKNFPHIKEWLDQLKPHPSLDRKLVEKAIGISNELLQDATNEVVLHGDLHHDNILRCEQQQWLAIDPKGVIGEPAYEVGAFLRNPMPQIFTYNKPQQLIQRRIDLISELTGLDTQRIKLWHFVQIILSVYWCLDGGYGDWRPLLMLAEQGLA